MVLLHAMALLREQHAEWRLRAIHIDHQLQANSPQWAERCLAIAEGLRVPCSVDRVSITELRPQGLEAAARHARYASFAAQLRAGEVLLTAHHADDQLETLLIALLRGSGVAGLASMPACAPFGAGFHLRPLLAFTRADLSEWAERQAIEFIEDPSNRNRRFDRNFLRHEIVPLLKSRWPAVAHTVTRSAQHLAEADALLTDRAEEYLRQVAVGECIDADRLRELDAAKRRLVLRRWIQQRGLLLPSSRTLEALDHDMLRSSMDRAPCVRWSGGEVNRHRNLLYIDLPRCELSAASLAWPWRRELALPDRLGLLRTSVAQNSIAAHGRKNQAVLSAERLPDTLTIRFRRGGERIRLAGEKHHRELKKLLQASDVLPWWRERLPLIYADDELVAVADLWCSENFAAGAGDNAVTVEWLKRPEIYAHSSV